MVEGYSKLKNKHHLIGYSYFLIILLNFGGTLWENSECDLAMWTNYKSLSTWMH